MNDDFKHPLFAIPVFVILLILGAAAKYHFHLAVAKEAIKQVQQEKSTNP